MIGSGTLQGRILRLTIGALPGKRGRDLRLGLAIPFALLPGCFAIVAIPEKEAGTCGENSFA